MTDLRRALLLGASLVSMSATAAAAAETAAATAATDANAQGLTEVVVTAERRPANLQKTAIAISVLGSQAIANRHVQSLVDLGDGAIPSLRVAPFYSRNSALIINIRGVGVLSDSNQPARDQGVGVYIDGVYLGRAQGLGAAIYDVDNISVLKGPQGTLFGRNTEGGAVNIITKRPSGKFKMSSTFGMSNYNGYKAETHIDLPEYQNVSLKFDAILTKRDGMQKNPLQGASDFNSYDKKGFHAEALWRPLPGVTADYSFDVSRDSTSSLYLQLISGGTLKQAVQGTFQPSRASVANVGVPQLPSVGDTDGHRLNLEWQALPHLTVKSITSFRHLVQTQFDNGSASVTMSNATGNFTNVNFGRMSTAEFHQHQGSEELQLIGDFDRVTYSAGALFYSEYVGDNAQAFATNTFTDALGTTNVVRQIDFAAQRIDRASHVKTTSAGVFGQATYTPPILSDKLHITGGLRYTEDTKKGELYIVNGATPNVNGVIAPRKLDASWSRVDPLVTLAYDVVDDLHVYGKWSTGYKSGGANSRSLNYAPFNPETVSMYELGAKAEFWDHRARLNVAAYTGSYKNIQLDFSAQYQQIINGVLLSTTRTTTETTNAPGTGKLSGFEAEFAVTPFTGFNLTASYAYNKVKIPKTINPFPQANGAFVTVPIPIYPVYTPENAATVAADYDRRMNGFTLSAHVDANYDSGYYANYTDPGFNTTTGQVTAFQPKGDASFVVNGRLAVSDIALGSSGGRLTVSVWSRNLLNEQHLFYKALSPLAGLNGFYNDARTFGVEANVKF